MFLRMLYLPPVMKKYIRPMVVIVLSLALALMIAGLTHIVPPAAGQENLSAAAFFFQTTATPEPTDLSEVGSTDGIAVMGFVIVAIVVLPILLRRKAWNDPQ